MRQKYYKVCNGAEKLVLKKHVRYVNCAGRYVARVYQTWQMKSPTAHNIGMPQSESIFSMMIKPLSYENY